MFVPASPILFGQPAAVVVLDYSSQGCLRAHWRLRHQTKLWRLLHLLQPPFVGLCVDASLLFSSLSRSPFSIAVSFPFAIESSRVRLPYMCRVKTRENPNARVTNRNSGQPKSPGIPKQSLGFKLRNSLDRLTQFRHIFSRRTYCVPVVIFFVRWNLFLDGPIVHEAEGHYQRESYWCVGCWKFTLDCAHLVGPLLGRTRSSPGGSLTEPRMIGCVDSSRFERTPARVPISRRVKRARFDRVRKERDKDGPGLSLAS